MIPHWPYRATLLAAPPGVNPQPTFQLSLDVRESVRGGLRRGLGMGNRDRCLSGPGVLILMSCGSTAEEANVTLRVGDNTITVASFDFGESSLLAELYSQTLENGGFAVKRAFNLAP